MFTTNYFIDFIVVLNLALMGPLIEEMIFRYFLKHQFGKKNLWLWVGISSIIFGFMHAGTNIPYLALYSMHGLIFHYSM